MKLYTFAVAPNPARVHFFLNEKVKGSEVAIDVQEVTVNFLTGEQKQPEFLAKNPAGTLPVLELDNGTCLLESLPIMEYLEELYPVPSLIGRSPLERARIRGVERNIEINILLRVIRAVHATRSPLGLPANPALAVYMSPWGIASSQTDRADLERVTPCIVAYLEHYLALGREQDWAVADPAAQRARDAQHLQLFFADELDPRAWNGVYRIVGEETGRAIKELMQNPSS